METLDNILNALKNKNPRNDIHKQEVITLTHKISRDEELPIVTIYPKDKIALFHGEFTQTAYGNPELKPLLDYFEKNDYKVPD